MKKLFILAIFVLLCACGLGQTTQTDANGIQRSVTTMRKQVLELQKLRDDFNATPRRLPEADYFKKAPETLSRFKTAIDQLDNQIKSYLNDLEIEQRAQFGPALENSVDQLKDANSEIDNNFKERKQTEGINKFGKSVNAALDSIDKTLNAADASARQRASGQSSPKPSASPQGQGEGQEQGKTSDFDYEPYLLALLLFIICPVTWWLHNRMAKLESALSKQNQSAPQLRQQLDQQLDEMWRELSKLQQQGADAQRQSHAQLLAEVERLRTTVQTLRTPTSGSEPRVVRRRVEEPAEYAPIAATSAAPRLASASDYLRRAAGSGVRAKAAMLRPDVLQAAEDDGPYLLLPADGQPNIYNVIPAVPRFQSAQDYSHFSHFYDCDQPSSGEVFIVQPARAVYDHTADQWKLRSKGRLQIS